MPVKKRKTSAITAAELQEQIKKVKMIYTNFQRELAILKAERIKIVERINKKADDKKIQEILKKIK